MGKLQSLITEVTSRTKKLFCGEYTLSESFYRVFRGKHLPEFFINAENNQKNNSPVTKIKAIANDGLSQHTHPSVIYQDGKYILAASPFPFSDTSKENPYIYVSDDGIDFSLEKGQLLALPDTKAYLSDPEIQFKSDAYFLYYRESLRTEKITKIYKRCSKDLKEWSEPVTLLETSESFLSPSAISYNGTDYIYAVNCHRDGTDLCRYIEKNGKIHPVCEILSVKGVPEDRIIWHVDVEIIKNKFVAIFTLSTDKSGKNSKIYYAVGNDDGSIWTVVDKINLYENEEKYFKNIYKASIVDIGGTIKLYVSAMNKKNAWHIYTIDFPENLL